MDNIALIGCGNIGRRHLQALAGSGRSLKIFIVEPNEQARDVARGSVLESADTQLFFLHSISELKQESINPIKLAIVATGAEVRRAVVSELLQHSIPQALLLEKVLLTSRQDLREVGEMLAVKNVKTYVNCGRRGFPGYQALKNTLMGTGETSLSVTGGGWGLCSNAVHFIDLAEFLFGTEIVSLSGENLDTGSVAAKRSGCVEVSGQLTGEFSGGESISIECLPGAFQPLTITLTVGTARWHIDEANRTVILITGDGLTQKQPFESRNVSEMGHLYVDLLEGRSNLPSYAQSARQHAFLLDTLKRHLNLSDKEDVHCPIS